MAKDEADIMKPIISNNNNKKGSPSILSSVVSTPPDNKTTKKDGDWVDFDGYIRNLGNKGKSRGVNLSNYTTELDLNKKIVGKFKIVDVLPTNKTWLEKKKQKRFETRINLIATVKEVVFQNQIQEFAKQFKVTEEEFLTPTNFDIYTDLLLQLSSIEDETNKTKDEITKYIENAQDEQNQLKQKMFELSEDVSEKPIPFIEDECKKTGYRHHLVFKRIVAPENLEQYRKFKQKYEEQDKEIKKLNEQLKQKASTKKEHIIKELETKYDCSIHPLIIESVEDDILLGTTEESLKKLREKSDRWIDEYNPPHKRKKRYGKR